jgi:hypothetical protein
MINSALRHPNLSISSEKFSAETISALKIPGLRVPVLCGFLDGGFYHH